MWRRVQWQRRTLPGKLVVFQPEPRRKRANAHAHAGEDGQFLVLLEVRVLHCATCERARGTVSRNRAEPGWSTPEAQRLAGTQKTDAGWRSQPSMRLAGRTWSGQRRM